jgi:serine/threonine-protein kinase
MTAPPSTSLWAVRARMREAQRLGQYRIEREIGRGRHERRVPGAARALKRPAAVKVLKPHLATDEAGDAVPREAQLAASSPTRTRSRSTTTATRATGAGTTRWNTCAASPSRPGAGDGPMPAARVVHALRQACGSLEEAHAAAGSHRDVKPGNLMLCVRGGPARRGEGAGLRLVKQVRTSRRATSPSTREGPRHAALHGPGAAARSRGCGCARGHLCASAPSPTSRSRARGLRGRTDHDIVYRVLNEPAPRCPDARPGAPELRAARRAVPREGPHERPAGIDEVRAVLDERRADLPWSEAEARAWWATRERRSGAGRGFRLRSRNALPLFHEGDPHLEPAGARGAPRALRLLRHDPRARRPRARQTTASRPCSAT